MLGRKSLPRRVPNHYSRVRVPTFSVVSLVLVFCRYTTSFNRSCLARFTLVDLARWLCCMSSGPWLRPLILSVVTPYRHRLDFIPLFLWHRHPGTDSLHALALVGFLRMQRTSTANQSDVRLESALNSRCSSGSESSTIYFLCRTNLVLSSSNLHEMLSNLFSEM